MKYLNLMPHYQKKSITRERLYLIAHNAVGIMLITITIVSILLLWSRFSLVNHFNELQENTSLVQTDSLGLQKNVSSINEKISTAQNIQKNFIKWTSLLTDFTTTIPEGIFINTFFINGETGAFRITGIAPTRDQLIALKAGLETFPNITSLDSPLSNFLEKENINFTFGGKIESKYYIYP